MKWYGTSMHPFITLWRSSTFELRNLPVTMIPVAVVAPSMRPNSDMAASTSRCDPSASSRWFVPVTSTVLAPSAVTSSTSPGDASPSTRSWPRRAISRASAGPE